MGIRYITVANYTMLYIRIGMQHSSTVCDEIRAFCERWYDLGVILKIDRNTLDGIKFHNTPAISCLNRVVVEWLKLNSSLSSLPTWSHLIKAIAQINMEREAKVLQQSHPVPRHNTSGKLQNSPNGCCSS